jgi:uncharacterized membrane protein YfcA
MIFVVGFLAGIIGILLGLLGGGGSILTLPMLVYVANVEPREAIASSLFVVGTTSIVGVMAHARAGRVVWRVGAIFGAAAMAGAYLGGRLAHFVPATILLITFASMMLLTSVAMLRGRRQGSNEVREVAVAKAMALGFLVGCISGLVGAGGGFLVVPALSILGGLPMPRAVGTSLFVIALQSLSGFAGHVAHVSLHWPLLGTVTVVCIAGSLVGARLAKRANPDLLRKGFGWLVLAMGIFLLGKQMPPGPLRDFGTPIGVFVVVAFAAVSLIRREQKTASP